MMGPSRSNRWSIRTHVGWWLARQVTARLRRTTPHRTGVTP